METYYTSPNKLLICQAAVLQKMKAQLGREKVMNLLANFLGDDEKVGYHLFV